MKFILLVASLLATKVIAAPRILSHVKRDISDLPEDVVNCDGTEFNDFQIEDAAQRAVNNGLDGSGAQPGGYPHVYRNDEGIEFSNCPSGTLAEFPILANGQVYGGGAPGAYRVVYQETGSGNGRYCGLIYHTSDGSFAECT